MLNIDKVLEAARRVEAARAELKAAEEAFAVVATGSVPKPPTPQRVAKNGAGSISQRVLKMVVDSGPAGIARKDIVGALGKTKETAVHSALKQHQTKGRVANENGRWVATAALIKELQFPRLGAQ